VSGFSCRCPITTTGWTRRYIPSPSFYAPLTSSSHIYTAHRPSQTNSLRLPKSLLGPSLSPLTIFLVLVTTPPPTNHASCETHVALTERRMIDWAAYSAWDGYLIGDFLPSCTCHFRASLCRSRQEQEHVGTIVVADRGCGGGVYASDVDFPSVNGAHGASSDAHWWFCVPAGVLRRNRGTSKAG
jgi:hypothetical protein